MKIKHKLLCALAFVFAVPYMSFAYVGDAFVTPDSWSKHISGNGVSASSSGIDFGDSGTLKLGLTTRAQLKFSDETDWSIYQYARARLSGAKALNGEINLNINARVAVDTTPRYENGEYSRYYDGILTSRKRSDFDYRIYQANLELNKVVPITDIDLGRIYLTTFDGYKIDGANILIDPSEYFKLNVYYGLPVSNYTNLKTQVAGLSFEVPIEKTATKIRGEYSYFMHQDGGDLNTHVARARLDQGVNIADVFNANIYAEGSMISDAYVYELGMDSNIDKSQTGLSVYVQGQSGTNQHAVNPYVSLYESLMGTSEYVMGGFMLTQGIKDFMVIGVGYEGRYNFTEAYGSRDYHRVFGNIDLVGLIHKNNYLSFIVDYYNVAKYKNLDENSKVLAGFRMTQIFTDKFDAWLGVNVMNHQFRNSPVKLSGVDNGFDVINDRRMNENTTVAYIGGAYRITDWCVLQLDYTFEYADIFKSADLQPDGHTVEMWLNFIW